MVQLQAQNWLKFKPYPTFQRKSVNSKIIHLKCIWSKPYYANHFKHLEVEKANDRWVRRDGISLLFRRKNVAM